MSVQGKSSGQKFSGNPSSKPWNLHEILQSSIVHNIVTRLVEASLGIDHRVICPHTSEQNDSVESRLRRVVEGGMSLLVQGAIRVRF